MTLRAPRLMTALALALLGAACAHGGSKTDHAPLTPDGQDIITEQEIASSGGRTAWEVLRRAAPYLNMAERGNGSPAVMRRHGRSSILLNDAPIVMVDGVRLSDFRNLDQIPASTIDHIVVMRGIDATTYYGTNAVGGVVLIVTKT
jgi:outer membrane cobalamin receptor